jgi:hypothetical protein
MIAPLASKSFTLVHPENYKYFLSKYSYFSYIDAYNTVNDEYLDDDNLIYLFLVPDIKKKLTSNKDYFNLDETEFKLSEREKNFVYTVLNESGNEGMSSNVEIVDPNIKKYSINVILRYFEGFEKTQIATDIRSRLNDYFLSMKRTDKIPKSDLIRIIEEIEGIDSVNIFFLSEENETAIRNGYYIKKTTKITPTIPFLKSNEGGKKRFVFFDKQVIETKVNIPSGTDPNLGLDDFGDIELTRSDLVLIRGGWEDRKGTLIEDDVKIGKQAGLSIYFKDKIELLENMNV